MFFVSMAFLLTSTIQSRFQTLFELNFISKKSLQTPIARWVTHYDLHILTQEFVEVLDY